MKLLFIGCIMVMSQLLYAQKTESVVYKDIDSTQLTLKVFYPNAEKFVGKRPAMIFFFGGGWVSRSIGQFEVQAKYFTSRGMVCFIADYRVGKINHTTPFVSVMDAKSAMRFIKYNAERFHINSARIVASGGSAGGHLAAATALIHDYNDVNDDLSISPKPSSLVLFNPVIDNGPGGYGYDRIGDQYKKFSPMYNIVKGAPPTIIFLGEKDNLIPTETMKNYQKKMKEVGSRCDLFLYPGQGHGFFNKPNYKNNTMYEADLFLSSLGYLKGKPELKIMEL
jgi:acetyl esterase